MSWKSKKARIQDQESLIASTPSYVSLISLFPSCKIRNDCHFTKHRALWDLKFSLRVCVLLLSARLPQSTYAEVAPGDLLYSRFFTYQVDAVLGRGTYGKVLKCSYVATDMTVAIKMMKNKGFLTEQAASEASEKAQRRHDRVICSLLVVSEPVSSVARLLLCADWAPAPTLSDSTRVSAKGDTPASCWSSWTKVWRTSWRRGGGSAFL